MMKKIDMELACKKVEKLQRWMESKTDPEKDREVDADEGLELQIDVETTMFKQRTVFLDQTQNMR